VHADVAAAVGDVALEGRLLGVVQDVAGGREPDDGLETGQVGGGELAGVSGGGDGETVLPPQFLDGRDPGGDGGMHEALGLVEDEHLVDRRLGGGRGGCDGSDD
jgi:hypothetical protein